MIVSQNVHKITDLFLGNHSNDDAVFSSYSMPIQNNIFLTDLLHGFACILYTDPPSARTLNTAWNDSRGEI